MPQPLADDGQVLALAERVEAHPQPEALGQRDFLLHRLAGVHVAVVGVGGAEVVLHLLGQEMSAVAGGVDQHVVAGLRDRAVEDGLQRLVAGLALVEAQVVAVDDEALRPLGDQVHEVRQVGEVRLVHLDQAQALVGEGVQAGLDQRAFARAARAGQQHVVGGAAGDELRGVAQQALLLRVHFLQVGELERRDVAHRLQHAALAALAVAEGDGRAPVRRAQRVGQHGFEARQQRLGPGDQAGEIAHADAFELNESSSAATRRGARPGCA